MTLSAGSAIEGDASAESLVRRSNDMKTGHSRTSLSLRVLTLRPTEQWSQEGAAAERIVRMNDAKSSTGPISRRLHSKHVGLSQFIAREALTYSALAPFPARPRVRCALSAACGG